MMFIGLTIVIVGIVGGGLWMLKSPRAFQCVICYLIMLVCCIPLGPVAPLVALGLTVFVMWDDPNPERSASWYVKDLEDRAEGRKNWMD